MALELLKYILKHAYSKKRTAMLKSYGIKAIMLPPYHPGCLKDYAQFECILEVYKLPSAKR